MSLSDKNRLEENDGMINNGMRLPWSFEAVKTPILVIDDNRQVLLTNDAAKKMIGVDQCSTDVPVFCHELLLQKQTPCRDCPLHASSLPTASLSKSHAIRKKDGNDIFIKETIAPMNGYYVLTLFDVSREITALKTMDLTRKELTAKAIMAEQRRREKNQENKDLNQIIDQLPEALVMVDGNFVIKQKNNACSEIFPSEGSTTCYELFGQRLPCDGCPCENGFENAHQKKKTHHVNGRYITETFSHMPEDNRGLLLFSDTTRQIQLIEKIREQQETITRKNEILSSLVKLQTKMHKSINMRDVIEFFLDVFMPICKTQSAAVILNDIRKSSVWLTVARGLDGLKIDKLTGAYLSREVQSDNHREIPPDFLPWKKTGQLSLMGGDHRRVGLILYQRKTRLQEGELLHLFSEPMGAFIHNKLLMRQLEEKANTDPLTGLYNRGYMGDALSAEKEKHHKYGLPYAVLVADVNQLKKANDVHGHEAGDRLILTVSEHLKSAVRDTDIVARTGGDEFLILLTDTDQKGAFDLIDRLKEKFFHDTGIPVGGNQTFPVSISLGAAGTDKTHPDDLIKTADQRMYEAKEAYYKNKERYR